MTNEIEQIAVPWTGTFWWTFERATEIANQISSRQDIGGDPDVYANLKGQYITAIKGEPTSPDIPEECWALSNRYDPKIIREDMRNIIKELLVPALRPYKHNIAEEGFVVGYDAKETIEILLNLMSKYNY